MEKRLLVFLHSEPVRPCLTAALCVCVLFPVYYSRWAIPLYSN